MNICPNCKHEFEHDSTAEPLCPKCCEPIDANRTLDADVDFTVDSTDDDFELEIAGGDEQTFASTQDTDHNDDLILPRAPIEPGKTTELVDSAGFAETESGSDDGDDDFVLASDDKTELATEVYDPVEKQPTLEVGDNNRSTASLGYAERMIAGLIPDEKLDRDAADYIISMQDSDSELGSGASGVVYKAKQKSLNRLVAIKLLKKQVQAGTQSQSRKTTPKQKDIEKFLYESQITAGLDHPNVITVHDLGVTSNDTLFYSMKLFEGGRDWSKDFDKNSLEQNLDIFNDVCDAMRRAHRDRIVHRDLKPQNVLVGDFGEVQVTDWGLAIDLNSEPDEQFSGGGTPCYMAPEMAHHYLAQQEFKSLRSKLEWTQENSKENSDEIQLIKEKLADSEFKEQKYREQISEASDVYVMGAILFQISSGYPPHLFQINDMHRRQWGSQSGRNKVRRELEMAANRTIARYLVKGLSNPEAREALRDIALSAMAANPADRYANVAALQQAVRDFRDFMRCIEDTKRGDREVESSTADPKSYVNLNNAIYAYEGALESYPEYEPAKSGHAKAKFLFSERALNNQDFELGLSTMTDDEIKKQPDVELASRLRNELVMQRNRRDRRKKLLFAATMASLVAIATGIISGGFAFYATQEANRQTTIAQQQKLEASQAEQRELAASIQLRDGLTKLRDSKEATIKLKVERAIAQRELDKLGQEKIVADISTEIADTDRSLAVIRTAEVEKAAAIKAQIAGIDLKIADLDRARAEISSERIKETNQFNQYISRLANIEDNIDETATRTQLDDVFLSEDISLKVKNAWELHHLFKRAYPDSEPILNPPLGQIKLFDASSDGQVVIAVGADDRLYRCSAADPQFSLIEEIEATHGEIVSMDVSLDGNWLVVAHDSIGNQTATLPDSLPLVFDLNRNRVQKLDDSIADKLRFQSLRPDSDGNKCKEKFFCNVQQVQILSSTANRFELFMVDQRSQLGVNQLRCSVSHFSREDGLLQADVQKVKVAGQLFRKDPGLLTGARCLATAVKSDDGTIYAGIINSHPGFGLIVFAFDDAVAAQQDALSSASAREEARYFSAMKDRRELLESLSPNFAPTALEFTTSSSGEIKLLVGNGKGEIADLTWRASQDGSFMLAAAQKSLINPATALQNKSGSRVLSGQVTQLKVDRNAPVFSSTNQPVSRRKQEGVSGKSAVHKTAVRAIRSLNDRLFSISESEILVWQWQGEELVATKRLFGQSGNLADLIVTSLNDKKEVYTVSNLEDGSNEMRHWKPDSTSHDATISFDNFRTQSGSYKRIVAGAADELTGSNAVAYAFDDGTIEYFSPQSGRILIGKPADKNLPTELDALSNDDFRNGRFGYFDEREQLVMFSNSAGMLQWNLNDPHQTDPLRPKQAASLFKGATTNSSVFFSADATGQNIVTSHPRKRDMIVLWQLRDGLQYVASEIGPFRKAGSEQASRLNMVVQPVISPDGKVIAAALRLRSAYQIQLIAATPSRSPEKIYTFDSLPRTTFRSIQFVDDQKISISEDRVTTGIDRQLGIVEVFEDGNRWDDRIVDVPESLTRNYRQISIASVSNIGDETSYAGFAIEKTDAKKDADSLKSANETPDCSSSSDTRQLIVWDSSGVLLSRRVPFSRRIAPRFHDGNLYYMEAPQSDRAVLQQVDLSEPGQQKASYELTNADTSEAARRWQLLNDGNVAYTGDGWLNMARLEANKLDHRVTSSLANHAQKIELAGNSMLVHHQDGSASLVSTKELATKKYKVARLKGFQDQIALSPGGEDVAIIKKSDGTVAIYKSSSLFADNPVPIELDQKPIAITWIRAAALRSLGVGNVTNDCLVSAVAVENSLNLNFWQSDGSEVQVPESISRLPLNLDRNQRVGSFEFSAVTGSLVSIVWETDNSDRADIWKFAATRKPAEGEDIKKLAHRWFLVDDSKVGRIESVHFSEVIDGAIPDDAVAPRIVIGSDNQGIKAVKLYALELGVKFVTRPLLELFVADKLQKVDKIVGAQFTGDRKTLLTMTSEVAQVRLSDGWEQEKADVAFDEKIRKFQFEIKENDAGTLNKEKNEFVQQLQNSPPNPELAVLEQRKKQNSESLAHERIELEKKLAGLQETEADARTRFNAEEQADIDSLADDIKEIEEKVKKMSEKQPE